MRTLQIRPLKAALSICLTVWSLAACTQLEKTVETHTTHFIDSGEAVANGAKVSDERPVEITVFQDWKAVGTELRRLNGMTVFTPSRARQLQVFEAAVSELSKSSDPAVVAAVVKAVRTASEASTRPTK